VTAYVVIIRDRTTNPDALARYRELAPKAREVCPLTPVAFYGPHIALEGDDAEGVAILRFTSMAAARAWYDSPEYQAALPYRQEGSLSRVFFVSGMDALTEQGPADASSSAIRR